MGGGDRQARRKRKSADRARAKRESESEERTRENERELERQKRHGDRKKRGREKHCSEGAKSDRGYRGRMRAHSRYVRTEGRRLKPYFVIAAAREPNLQERPTFHGGGDNQTGTKGKGKAP